MNNISLPKRSLLYAIVILMALGVLVFYFAFHKTSPEISPANPSTHDKLAQEVDNYRNQHVQSDTKG